MRERKKLNENNRDRETKVHKDKKLKEIYLENRATNTPVRLSAVIHN